jgi:alpha,alpha-trehalase
MVSFSEKLGRGEEDLWRSRADHRKTLLDRYLFVPEKGFYLDWNFFEEKHSPMVSVASLFPLFLGFSHPSENLMKILEEEMLLPFGVAATVKPQHPYALQWEYPNLWAPLQYVAYCACKNAGREDLAEKIAKKYMTLLERNFEITGNIWEKYDSITGQVVNAEYNAPPMMGWTAGVYLYFYHQYKKYKNITKIYLQSEKNDDILTLNMYEWVEYARLTILLYIQFYLARYSCEEMRMIL